MEGAHDPPPHDGLPSHRHLISKPAAELLTMSSRNRQCCRHNGDRLYLGKLCRADPGKGARGAEYHAALWWRPRCGRGAQPEDDALSTAEGEGWENGGGCTSERGRSGRKNCGWEDAGVF